MTNNQDQIAKAIHAVAAQLSSPNVVDSNWETANIVDAIAKVAFAISHHADCMEAIAIALNEKVAPALNSLDPNFSLVELTQAVSSIPAK
jgi:hypothetical protein